MSSRRQSDDAILLKTLHYGGGGSPCASDAVLDVVTSADQSLMLHSVGHAPAGVLPEPQNGLLVNLRAFLAQPTHLGSCFGIAFGMTSL